MDASTTKSDVSSHYDDRRSPSPTSSNSGNDTVFKRLFKRYKARQPPPDLNEVIDLRFHRPESGIRVVPFPESDVKLGPNASKTLELLGLKPIDQWSLATIDSRPGLFVLNDIFRDDQAHLQWMQRCLCDYPQPPNITNLTAHYPSEELLAGGTIFNRFGEKLRWTTIGKHYDWVTKEYPENGQPMPVELHSLGATLAKALEMTLDPDTMIINYYPDKATLSPHVDRSERVLDRPLISVSFGQSAVYLTGGKSLDDPVDAIFLHSGDVLIMTGEQRLVYHAVPAVIQRRPFEDQEKLFDQAILDYANKNRLNMTIRQVDDIESVENKL